jgi:hypothetical protein
VVDKKEIENESDAEVIAETSADSSAEKAVDLIPKKDSEVKTNATPIVVADAQDAEAQDAENAPAPKVEVAIVPELKVEPITTPEPVVIVESAIDSQEGHDCYVFVQNNSHLAKFEPKTRTHIPAKSEALIECGDAETKEIVLKNIAQFNILAGYNVLQVIE